MIAGRLQLLGVCSSRAVPLWTALGRGRPDQTFGARAESPAPQLQASCVGAESQAWIQEETLRVLNLPARSVGLCNLLPQSCRTPKHEAPRSLMSLIITGRQTVKGMKQLPLRPQKSSEPKHKFNHVSEACDSDWTTDTTMPVQTIPWLVLSRFTLF